MKLHLRSVFLILVIILINIIPQSAMAYIGPGTGLSVIGAFLAAITAIIAALFGFLWYPIKRLLRAKKAKSKKQEGNEE